MAKRKLYPRPATELGNEGADSTSAWANGTLWTSLYVLPGKMRKGATLLTELDVIRTDGLDGPWVVMGDVNESSTGVVPQYMGKSG